ncbi:helix-turn-helix transcriptional regulator [Lacticaseibacillus porcinae]|uniref:helix-turn-helix transcriptional regulator n=1 Tax=Lacticaseibacillus porcinae TaxID=1123687 RepID=UPI0013DDD25A|nr:WYL domain-containing protein [Lacticaseibacillus porcinae]
MQKSLRIQTEMRYINNRERFNIKDLQMEFEISRATAIRDLDEIQTLGLPLTSQPGHNGGYAVLRNQTLIQVQFNQTELAALFTAFLATTNAQLPFLKSRQAIVEKLLAIVSPEQKQQLLALRQILVFENTNPDDPDLLELTDHAPDQLGPLIALATQTKALQFTYTKVNGEQTTRKVWLNHIYQRMATWYFDGMDIDKHATRLFRVDRIAELSAGDFKALTEATIKAWQSQATPPNVDLQLDAEAISRFRRYHQPGRSLQFLDPFQQSARLIDHLNDQDPKACAMYADWLLSLGTGVQVKQLPQAVTDQIKVRLQAWQ